MFSKPIIETQAIAETSIESPTEVPTETPTENPLEFQTQSPIENPTESPTEFPTEFPSQSPAESPTQTPTYTSTENPIETITESSTETSTEISTSSPTEESTKLLTDFPIQKQTEVVSDNINDKPIDKITNKPDYNHDEKKECSNEEIISLNCSNGYVKNEQYKDLHEQIKKEILNNNTYHGEKKVFKTKNVIFQISKLKDQDEEKDISTIDLGQCERNLKRKYNIPEYESIIIYKSDIKSIDLDTSYVQYELYHPTTLEPLDLSECSNDQITISVSVNLNNDTLNLYNSLSDSGHNLFDVNDSFYNDICVTYTTENGRDMGMSDRKQTIEESGGNLCQTGCKLQNYNNNY